MSVYVHASDVDDVPDGGVIGVEVEGVELALVRDGGDIWAVHDECTHASIPLSEGDVEGCEIECWLHGSRFDVRTGACLNPPATEPVQTYPIKIEGDAVLVDLSSAAS